MKLKTLKDCKDKKEAREEAIKEINNPFVLERAMCMKFSGKEFDAIQAYIMWKFNLISEDLK